MVSEGRALLGPSSLGMFLGRMFHEAGPSSRSARMTICSGIFLPLGSKPNFPLESIPIIPSFHATKSMQRLRNHFVFRRKHCTVPKDSCCRMSHFTLIRAFLIIIICLYFLPFVLYLNPILFIISQKNKIREGGRYSASSNNHNQNSTYS